MRAVVTLEQNDAFRTDPSQREYNAVSSCLHPTWTLVEAALSNHSNRDGDECRCYDDRFSATSKRCMPCYSDVPGSCDVAAAVTSGVCSSSVSAPVKLRFVAGVMGTIEEFNLKKQAYISAVSTGLRVAPAAVTVTDLYLAGSRRRLLAATSEVMVETEALVAPETVPDATGAALTSTLSAGMQEAGIDIAAISGVTTTPVEPDEDDNDDDDDDNDDDDDDDVPIVLSAPVSLEFVASVVGSMMEFVGSQNAYKLAVANSLVVEPAAVTIDSFSKPDSRRRLLATTSEVMVVTRVVVPPERVPDVSGPALVDTFRSQMQSAGLEISAVWNVGVTTIEAVATTTTPAASTTPVGVPEEEDGMSSMLIIAGASAGGVVFLCFVCGCVICICNKAEDDAHTQVKGGSRPVYARVSTHGAGLQYETMLPRISVDDMCV
jgi:hypothetical protein